MHAHMLYTHGLVEYGATKAVSGAAGGGSCLPSSYLRMYSMYVVRMRSTGRQARQDHPLLPQTLEGCPAASSVQSPQAQSAWNAGTTAAIAMRAPVRVSLGTGWHT